MELRPLALCIQEPFFRPWPEVVTLEPQTSMARGAIFVTRFVNREAVRAGLPHGSKAKNIHWPEKAQSWPQLFMNRTLSCEGYHSMRCNIMVQLRKPANVLRELSYNSAKDRNWSDRGNLTPHTFVHTIVRGEELLDQEPTGDAVVVLAEPYEGELLPSSSER